MKKSLRERLNASLDKALDPPRRRPKQDLDALLEEYNDGQSIAARKDSAQESSEGIPSGIPTGIPEGIPTGIPDAIPPGIPSTLPDKPPQEPRKDAAVSKRQPRAAIPKQEEPEEAGAEIFVSVDATHTASEKIVYSHMYRETVSKGRQEGHFGPALLMKLSGIRSRNTVHKALYGLIEKLSVEKVAEASGHPLGPRYRVYGPQEILRRRKVAGMVIDIDTKKIMERGTIPETIPEAIPEGIPDGIPRYPKNWDTPLPEIGIVGIPNFGILLNRENILGAESSAGGSSSNKLAGVDDEAFAGFVELMRKASEEVTGRAPTAAEKGRWTDLAELLAAELKIAAGRTTVSSAPAFLTEHLRRRLWKKDAQQVEAEDAQRDPAAAKKDDIRRCPDCFGTGMFYPEGYDKGVAKCGHERLPAGEAAPDVPDAEG